MLDNFNDWMQRYGQKTSKMFPPINSPQDFFQKSGSVTFVPLWCPNFMHKIRKNTRIQEYKNIFLKKTLQSTQK